MHTEIAWVIPTWFLLLKLAWSQNRPGWLVEKLKKRRSTAPSSDTFDFGVHFSTLVSKNYLSVLSSRMFPPERTYDFFFFFFFWEWRNFDLLSLSNRKSSRSGCISREGRFWRIVWWQTLSSNKLAMYSTDILCVQRSSCSCSPIPPAWTSEEEQEEPPFHSSQLYMHLIITRILWFRHDVLYDGWIEIYCAIEAKCCICLKIWP